MSLLALVCLPGKHHWHWLEPRDGIWWHRCADCDTERETEYIYKPGLSRSPKSTFRNPK